MVCFPWGKLDEYESHHLAHHCADVAACFEAICELPIIRARLETVAGRYLDDTDIARLALLTFLHDIGKLHPEFQAKALPHSRTQKRGHSAEGLAALFKQVNKDSVAEEIYKALPIDAILGWSDSVTLSSLIYVVFAHHGRPVTVSEISKNAWSDTVPGLKNYSILTAIHEIGNLLKDWFPGAFSIVTHELPSSVAFQHLFCGLVSLADWIGSDAKHFRFVASLDETYMADARQLAKYVIKNIGLDPRIFRESIVGTGFANIAPDKTPRQAQAVIGQGNPTLFFATFLLTTRVSLLHARARTRFFS